MNKRGRYNMNNDKAMNKLMEAIKTRNELINELIDDKWELYDQLDDLKNTHNKMSMEYEYIRGIMFNKQSYIRQLESDLMRVEKELADANHEIKHLNKRIAIKDKIIHYASKGIELLKNK